MTRGILQWLSLGMLFVVWSAQGFAADQNFSAGLRGGASSAARNPLCERLLDADLSGIYQVTNLKTDQATLVQLRRLGSTAAYTVSSIRMHLPADGSGRLTFERTSPGWLVGDSSHPKARANVMSLERTNTGNLAFNFEDAQDASGNVYQGTPKDTNAVVGNQILPDSWIIHLDNEVDADIRFTRLDLNGAFDGTVTRSLKSLLAERLDNEGSAGQMDYVFVIEMKHPMTAHDASQILDTPKAVAFDARDLEAKSYRFAVTESVHDFLEQIGPWLRRWEIHRIDVLPSRLLNDQALQGLSRSRPAAGGTQSSPSSVSRPIFSRASFTPTSPASPAAPAAPAVEPNKSLEDLLSDEMEAELKAGRLQDEHPEGQEPNAPNKTPDNGGSQGSEP